MKKSNLIYIGLAAFIIAFSKKNSLADTGAAAEITYRHVSGSIYEFNVVYFLNCFSQWPVYPPSTVDLMVKSASLGIGGKLAVQLPRIAIPQNLAQAPNIYNCSSAPHCFEEHVFRGNVDMSVVNPSNPLANDWVFYIEECCRPRNLYFLYNNLTGIPPLYADCGMNNLDFPNGNDAPFWHARYPHIPGHLNDIVVNYPITSVCMDRWIDFNENVIEYEGDSVSYELITSRDYGGVPLSYKAGFSLSYPMPALSPPGFSINPSTGQIHYFPISASYFPGYPGYNNYMVTIKATEYRTVSGVPVEMGYVTRDLIVYYEPLVFCPNDTIEIENNFIMERCSDTSITVISSVNFNCNTADIDGSFLIFTDSSNGNPVPISSVEVSTCWYGLIADEFEVILTNPLSPGTYYLTFQKGNDANTIISECGTELAELEDTIKVKVDSVALAEILRSEDANQNSLPYIAANCGQTSLELEFSGDVRCSSIDLSGSDFQIYDSTTTPATKLQIISATPVACVWGVTDKVTLVFTPALKSGKYGIYLVQGSDGNTVSNLCRVESDLDKIEIRNPELNINLGPDLFYCKDSVFEATLTAPLGYASYAWNTGQGVRQIKVNKKGTYYVTIGNGYGCVTSDTIQIKEIECFTGIEHSAGDAVSIYPNPTKGKLFIQNSFIDRHLKIEVMNMKGEKVFFSASLFKQGKTEIVDLSDLSKGIYLVRIIAEGQVLESKKIVLE